MSTATSLPVQGKPRKARRKSVVARNLLEGGVVTSLAMSGLFTLLITAGIIYALAHDAGVFFRGVPGRFEGVRLSEFFGSLHWSPLLGTQKHFGVWPLVVGTAMISLVAMLVAGPLGLITAIWLSEYAPPQLRNILKPVLEILAGVPTVVLGFFALTVITPALQFSFWKVPVIGPNGSPLLGSDGNPLMQPLNPFGIEGYNVLSAGIAVGILTLPIVTSLAEDALRAVPQALREGAYGVGATRFETSVRIVFPAALSGIIAALLLAIARCIGETMIVALAAGGRHLPMHYLTDPPLVTHVWANAGHRDGNGGNGSTISINPSTPFAVGPVRLSRGEKIDEVDVVVLASSTARTLRAELLAADDTVLATVETSLSPPSGASTFTASLVFPPINVVAPDRAVDEARQSGVRLDRGDYRVRLSAADGTLMLAHVELDGERYMPFLQRLFVPVDVRQSMQPMTGYLVQIFLGDVTNLGIEYYSSYAVAALLFVMTFALTVIGHLIRVRYQQRYE